MGKLVDLDEIDRLKYEEEKLLYRLSRSKSSLKKDMYEITDFGKSLIQLNKDQLYFIPLDSTTRENIIEAKNMQKIALKRQIQFVGKLLRKVDNIQELHKAYDVIKNNDQDTNLFLRRINNIRESLVDLNKSKSILEQLIIKYPKIDMQRLRQLIINHHKEVIKSKPSKSFKEIFQFLKTNIDRL